MKLIDISRDRDAANVQHRASGVDKHRLQALAEANLHSPKEEAGWIELDNRTRTAERNSLGAAGRVIRNRQDCGSCSALRRVESDADRAARSWCD